MRRLNRRVPEIQFNPLPWAGWERRRNSGLTGEGNLADAHVLGDGTAGEVAQSGEDVDDTLMG